MIPNKSQIWFLKAHLGFRVDDKLEGWKSGETAIGSLDRSQMPLSLQEREKWLVHPNQKAAFKNFALLVQASIYHLKHCGSGCQKVVLYSTTRRVHHSSHQKI